MKNGRRLHAPSVGPRRRNPESQSKELFGGSVCESNAPLTPQGANRRF